MKPIEYVGAAPMKKKRRSSLGGWLLVVFAVTVGGFFVSPFVPFLQAQQSLTSDASLRDAILELELNGEFGSSLAVAALRRTQDKVVFDGSYFAIDFPGGDIPSDRGKAEDVIVRAYRSVGIDLQQELHKDLKRHFYSYPQVYGASGPDTNVDHRRVRNLQRFFSRNGQSLAKTFEPNDYQPGDLIVWKLLDGEKHIGIVVPGPGLKASEPWIVHNLRSGPVWEDALFNYPIDGHYRYQGR